MVSLPPGERGEGFPGLAEQWYSLLVEELSLSWLLGLPCRGASLRWERAIVVLGFSGDSGHGEALEQPWLAGEGALRWAPIPLRCSAVSQPGPIPTLGRDQSGDPVTMWPRERVYKRFVHQKLQNAPRG